MEYCRGRSDQAWPRRRSHSQIAYSLRTRWPLTFRAGQMVSGREPAALGVRALLAQGRRADLEEFRPDRQGRRAARIRDRRCRAFCRRDGEETRRRLRVHHAGVRRPFALVAEGSRPAAQRRSQRFQTVRSGRALAHGAGVRSGAQRAQGFRAADPALERRCRSGAIFLTLAQRALEVAARQSVPDAGRFPAGLAAADRLIAAYSGGGISLHRRAGSAGAARSLAGASLAGWSVAG